jgi:Mg2+ and Co2+ transporter CorA
MFGMHPLALEDTVNRHQRAKVEHACHALREVVELGNPDLLRR